MPTIDLETVEQLRQELHSEKFSARHKLIRAMAGSMRLRILTLLYIHRDGLSIVDLSRILHASLSRISHQMRILIQYDIIQRSERNGKTIYKIRFLELVKRLTRE